MIDRLHAEMKELTLLAGVNEKQYDSVLKEELREDATVFLQDVYANEFKQLKQVYGLVTPEVWKNYKLLGVKDLAEQISLRLASRNLKRKWRVKYGKVKVEAHQDGDQADPKEE